MGCNQSKVHIKDHSIGGSGITRTKRLATFWKYQILEIQDQKPLIEPERQLLEFQVKDTEGIKLEMKMLILSKIISQKPEI